MQRIVNLSTRKTCDQFYLRRSLQPERKVSAWSHVQNMYRSDDRISQRKRASGPGLAPTNLVGSKSHLGQERERRLDGHQVIQQVVPVVLVGAVEAEAEAEHPRRTRPVIRRFLAGSAIRHE